MYVRKLNVSDDQILTEFLNIQGQKSPSILGYHYPVYRDMLSRISVGEDYYLGLFEKEELIGYLPGFIKKTNVGNAYCSLPFFGPNAGIILADNIEKEQGYRMLIEHLLQNIERIGNFISVSIYTPFLFNEYGLYEGMISSAILVDKFTQYLFLPDTKWDNKISYDLRKANKSGIVISNEISKKNIDDFYQIYLDNCVEYSIPVKPKEAVYYLIEKGMDLGIVTLDFTFYEGKMIAGLMMLWGPSTASYYIPCTVDSVRTLQPNTLLIDHAVNYARQHGKNYWNWESSPAIDSGVFKFKKKWGSNKGDYKIIVYTPQGTEILKSLGKETIQKKFPYFFIYPFQNLEQ